jgi:hypothetical protein
VTTADWVLVASAYEIMVMVIVLLPVGMEEGAT